MTSSRLSLSPSLPSHAAPLSQNLAKDKLRPLIREKIKKEVDIRLLSYLDNIRLKVAQRAAAKKAAKKKGKGKKGKGKDGAPAADAKKPDGAGDAAAGEEKKEGEGGAAGAGGAAAASGGKSKKKGSKGSKKKKKAKKCCEGEKACAHMPLGDMISLLVKMGILQELRRPLKRVADLQGDTHWLGSEYVNADVSVDPSMAQLRSVVTETFILPLGSAYVKEQAPLFNSLLLYGPHGSGKTLLSKAIAAETVSWKCRFHSGLRVSGWTWGPLGASMRCLELPADRSISLSLSLSGLQNSCWFDLSPRNIERKLGTKAEIAKLVHMVFKVASELSPSVIYIDDADRVFQTVKSKKNVPEVVKMKSFIMTHKAMLTRQVRCLVVGNSRQPFDAKVDRKDLNKFFGAQSFGKMLFAPCPNYATRLLLWKQFIIATGLNYNLLEKNPKFDVNTLAYISEGYSAGNVSHQFIASSSNPRLPLVDAAASASTCWRLLADTLLRSALPVSAVSFCSPPPDRAGRCGDRSASSRAEAAGNGPHAGLVRVHHGAQQDALHIQERLRKLRQVHRCSHGRDRKEEAQ